MAAVTKEELLAEVREKKERVEEINIEYAGQRFDDETRSEYNLLNTQIDELEATVAELQSREERIRSWADNPAAVERVEMPSIPRPGVARGDDIWDLSTVTRSWDDPGVEARQMHDRALRALEQAKFPHPQADRERSQGHLERLLGDGEEGDRKGADVSRHIMLTGSPQYRRAFTKYLQHGASVAGLSERDAGMLYRAMSLTTTSGGFAVPYVLDPTLIPTSNGAVNPYRQIGNVIQITVDEWRGVSSGGVTPAFQAEAAATTDASPTLAQPTVSTEMARATIPYSIEIGMDWGAFASEMANDIQDGKDVLEATKFAVGSGTNEPFGVVTGATTVFTAADTDSLVLADIYSWHNALPPRFRNGAVATFNNNILDKVRQIDTAGGSGMLQPNIQLRSAAQVATMVDGRAGVDLFGHPVYEASGQSSAMTTGQLIGVIGDYGRYFKIVDRVGLSIVDAGYAQDATSGLPTGQKFLFAYWRVGSKVLHANAFRTLKLA
jgi:HK97 family phage major capsid protein